MKVKYTGNGSLSSTYNGITYYFDTKERTKDIPLEVYDYIKLSRHIESTYLQPDFGDLEVLKKENDELKKEVDKLKKEIANFMARKPKGKLKKEKLHARRKKAL